MYKIYLAIFLISVLDINPSYAESDSLLVPVDSNKATQIKTTTKIESAIFLQRSEDFINGTSSDQKVTFSAEKVLGKIQVSYTVNEKTFIFVYDSIGFNEKKINSFQLIPESVEQNTKTKEDSDILILLFKELEKYLNKVNPLEHGILFSLDLLVNMIPENESLNKIDFTNTKYNRTAKKITKVSEMCSYRGISMFGTFDDDNGKKYKEKGVVGDPASECLGRCGEGCIQSKTDQDKKRQYTSQCFVHDLCTGHFGEVFGRCSDEFADAVASYKSANNCSIRVIGKWKLNNKNSSFLIILFPDGKTDRCSDNSYCTSNWKLEKNKLTITIITHSEPMYIPNLDTYIETSDLKNEWVGIIDESNIYIKGYSTYTWMGNTGSGLYFAGIYLTTSTDE